MHLKTDSATQVSDIHLDAERHFTALLLLDDLDHRIAETPALKESFENALESALLELDGGAECEPRSLLFLQRILYRINRLKLFWYDDLNRYSNEGSLYLFSIQRRIESAWQDWESHPMDTQLFRDVVEVKHILRNKAAEDLNPKPSAAGLYFRNEMTETGYRRLLAITSLDGLVEASQLSRVLGGAANEVQATLTRIFSEEYGKGILNRKHSTYFSAMLEEFQMNTQPEAYFDLAP